MFDFLGSLRHSASGARRTRRALLWSGALLLLPLLTLAGQSEEPAVTLRMKFKQDEVSKYRCKIEMDMQTPALAQAGGMQMEMNFLYRYKTLKTLPAGGGEVKVSVLESKMSVNGQKNDALQDTPPMTLTFDAQGNVKSMTGLPQDNPAAKIVNGLFNQSGAQMQSVFLPKQAIRPGDKWESPFKLPGFTEEGTAKSEFLKIETVGRYRTARIRTKIAVPMKMMMSKMGQPTQNADEAMMKMTGTTTMTLETNFAITEGKIIRTTSDTEYDMQMEMTGEGLGGEAQGPLDIDGKMKMEMNLVE
jgi:hypothetical protein